MKTDRERKNAAIVVIRWSARVLGLIMAGFLLLMFIGQSLESKSLPVSIEPIAAIGLALMGIYVVAMLLALKWERVGLFLGVAALGGFFVILFLGLLPGKCFRRFQYQRRPKSGISSLMATDPVVLAVLETRKAWAGTQKTLLKKWRIKFIMSSA